ncbi:16S rRNA m(5)C-967 methyltransferase [Sulfurivirga caldicuralii]|uniref:16S rRNA (cytosine(967)-C(5))-methyltransferase n=1 Tax=Sulfurivirga caldicuralii TaxID=364032 RepID=A0A1N6DIY9_9GAMM|nr:16S rRNA (cytosine(967)-C(5))-methyltransferase RsmB [Sulfurivirga caldicuralii]SIN70644.1 16S rRNA m(5)C-967 methyltransferase [Sulfurivirga caldicuralii]
MSDARRLAWEGLQAVIIDGRSLSAVLPPLLQQCPPAERALLQNLLYGVLRWLESLRALLRPLLHKPLKNKDRDIELLLLMGLYQLHCMDAIPAHAAVNESVRLLPKKKAWARGLINGVLRNFARTSPDTRAQWLACCERARYSHPDWLIERLKADWPEAWETILEANNQNPPLSLRINPLKTDRNSWMALPEVAAQKPLPHALSPQAVILETPCDVTRLPGYAEGAFSVQDVAAQQAGFLLDPKPGERILDACAAPGGKTTHLLELTRDKAYVLALEKDPQRIPRLQENLQRLDLHAQVRQGNAAKPDDWWDGKPFDRILLDAPCSATGIIRRHPDIKWHRTPADIAQLTATQANILHALWPLLKPGGWMLYSTCSVLAAENRLQMEAFLADTPDAQAMPISHLPCHGNPGCQIFPGDADMDGFYYALLQKTA